MAGRIPRFAILGGVEVSLIEVIPHAFSGDAACVFADAAGGRRYVSLQDWLAGARAFDQMAAANQVVTANSRKEDKLALFRSLFRGRADVYAHGYARKDGGIGYTPACANEWAPACLKRNRSIKGPKCAKCDCRAYLPVSDSALLAHFNGNSPKLEDVMGLYVLTEESKTYLLVADFDKTGWQRETALYREACIKHGLQPAVERSRSGNGAHVWLFFEEAVDAALARNLGCALITEAMDAGAGMDFSAYDRLFPTQDTLTEDGLGNLIALPLQGRARQDSNSVFVDDNFNVYPDQWRYLSSIRRVAPEQVKSIVDAVGPSPLGRLAHPRQENSGKAGVPIDQIIALDALSQSDFPRAITVAKANMLRVPKAGLSVRALNRIRRLAAFGNPEFYRAQAMHQPVYGKQRIIWCGEEGDDCILLPRGCEAKLLALFEEHGCVCSFDDQRSAGAPIRAEFAGSLRERQQLAADEMLRHECGVLSAPTGFGKTVVGAYLIATLGMNALIIVPKTTLIDQWMDALERFLSIKDIRPPLLTKSGKPSKRKRLLIGRIGGGKHAASGIIDIATFQSLSMKDDLGIPRAKPEVGGYGLVMVDECHYGGAPNLELVMRGVNARRVYGLSATPKRSDRLEGIVFMQCGPIRYRVDPKEQAAEQGFRRVLQPRFTRVRLASLEPGSSYNQVVDALCEHEARNGIIVADVVQAVREGRTPLVITRRREHAARLHELLEHAGVEALVLTGEGSVREKRERMAHVRSAVTQGRVIVATGSYIGEGFDLPELDMLVLASPYSWEGVITQYSGRLHRENEGKSDVVVYDYVDASVPMLERMYKKRLQTYAKLGYEVAQAAAELGPCARIVGRGEWRGMFLADVEQASKEVLVSAPYANPRLVEDLLPAFASVAARGVPVRVVLRAAKRRESESLQREAMKSLESVGCAVDIVADVPSGIALVDGKVVWYGTLPLLAFPKKEDCSLRVESAEIAADVADILFAGLEQAG